MIEQYKTARESVDFTKRVVYDSTLLASPYYLGTDCDIPYMSKDDLLEPPVAKT